MTSVVKDSFHQRLLVKNILGMNSQDLATPKKNGLEAKLRPKLVLLVNSFPKDTSAGWAPQIHRVHGVHCHRPAP